MKKLLIGFLIVSLLIVGVVAPASAIFSDTEVVKIRGNTGNVDISCPYKVILPDDIYPGYTGTIAVKVVNHSTCKVKLTITVDGKPPWLIFSADDPNPFVLANGWRAFTFTVKMLSGVGNLAMNKPVSFTITFTATNN